MNKDLREMELIINFGEVIEWGEVLNSSIAYLISCINQNVGFFRVCLGENLGWFMRKRGWSSLLVRMRGTLERLGRRGWNRVLLLHIATEEYCISVDQYTLFLLSHSNSTLYPYNFTLLLSFIYPYLIIVHTPLS